VCPAVHQPLTTGRDPQLDETLYQPFQENIIMNAGLQNTRRWIIAFVVATLVVVTAAYGPVALEMAGIEAGTPVYACQSPAGGC
jgi:hypothetical protein